MKHIFRIDDNIYSSYEGISRDTGKSISFHIYKALKLYIIRYRYLYNNNRGIKDGEKDEGIHKETVIRGVDEGI